LFDSVAIRVNGPKAWDETLAINWHLTDENQRSRMVLSNGAMVRKRTVGVALAGKFPAPEASALSDNMRFHANRMMRSRIGWRWVVVGASAL